jgi:hypothetical protein
MSDVPTVKLPANRFQTCRVGYLRKLLEGMDDDTVVVIKGSDFSYIPSTPRKSTALWNYRGGRLSEDHGDGLASRNEVRIEVLVVM